MMFAQKDFAGEYIQAPIFDDMDAGGPPASFARSSVARRDEDDAMLSGEFSALDFASDFGLEEGPLPLPDLAQDIPLPAAD